MVNGAEGEHGETLNRWSLDQQHTQPEQEYKDINALVAAYTESVRALNPGFSIWIIGPDEDELLSDFFHAVVNVNFGNQLFLSERFWFKKIVPQNGGVVIRKVSLSPEKLQSKVKRKIDKLEKPGFAQQIFHAFKRK